MEIAAPNNNLPVFKPELMIISQAINLSEDFIPIDEIKLADLQLIDSYYYIIKYNNR